MPIPAKLAFVNFAWRLAFDCLALLHVAACLVGLGGRGVGDFPALRHLGLMFSVICGGFQAGLEVMRRIDS